MKLLYVSIGTIFRLPIRTSDQSKESLLSKRSMSNEELSSLLHSLADESSSILLFLKSVESIEIQEWKGMIPFIIIILLILIINH